VSALRFAMLRIEGKFMLDVICSAEEPETVKDKGLSQSQAGVNTNKEQ
jgi:hypothetical protein